MVSGKSSILKTVQKNYNGKDLKFLNISLATFKEEKAKYDEAGNIIETDKDVVLRLIETSILQQIFYHEEDTKIPDSRFKKIKSYSLQKLISFSIGYLLFFIALTNYFYPDTITKVFKNYTIDSPISDILHYSSICIILFGLYFFIFKSIRILSSITISKLQIQNVEMGVGESLNKSVLNHHIDEILYFFSVRPYNVVIFEDLDRFQQTEIFTKLREINLILNNSEKTKRKEIVFIYAVRDDMFTDKERTKFFDFILPIIPVINSSNSSEILFKKKEQYKYNLSDSLIEDISFFIDDMRLLHNISNEFYLYKLKLNENLSEDKLFALITYKNIYPNDFVKLSNNEGELYHIINSKKNYLKDELIRVEKEIKNLRVEIESLENLYINNIKDLRLQYILRALEVCEAFKSFSINQADVSIDDLCTEGNFSYLQKDAVEYYKFSNNYYGYDFTTSKIKLPIKFKEIEKK
jgi:hypothetical protein